MVESAHDGMLLVEGNIIIGCNPATRLKIDRVFINEMHSDDSIARMVISLGHSLAMQITAEGVETSEQQQKLQQLGCDEGQGWLYAPPLADKDLSGWLQQHG